MTPPSANITIHLPHSPRLLIAGSQASRVRRRRRPAPRRGIVSILAMIFLALFSALAIGFYATINTAVQVSYNDQHGTLALTTAGSGMDFMRYQLATLTIPASTPPDQLFDKLYEKLQAQLDGTLNLGDGNDISRANGVISIPGPANAFVKLDASGDADFRATIQQVGLNLRVTVTGRYGDGSVTRTIQMDYGNVQKPSSIFDFGVASRSPISMTGNTTIRGAADAQGSVLSTSLRIPTISMTGNNTISGDISMVNLNSEDVFQYNGNSSIAGSTNRSAWADHVHYGVTAPEFPEVVTADFEPYATNLITKSQSGNQTLSNIRIKANTNPTLSGNITLMGVIYIETPNIVTFSGNLTIQGAVVVQDNPTGDPSTNQLNFTGNVTFMGVDTLPASYGDLRNLKGAMILAPTFDLKMSGNFHTISGSVVASQMEFSGNAGGTINGSIINLDDTAMTLTGNTNILINGDGVNRNPAGLRFGSTYAPLPDTYAEMHS